MGVPISNVTRRVVYTASGTGPYNFTFEILAAGDVAVYRDDTLLTITTDYTVTINANGTGFITLVASPTGATQIAIVGNRTIQRTTDFVTGGDFFANTVNDEMDQQTIFAQQNAEGLQRALQAPQTDPTTIDMTLPRAAIRASKVLSFDANGNPSATEFIGSNRGNWASGTLYYVRDIIKDTSTSNIWQCVVEHTSTGAQPIGTNADAAKWFLLVDAASAGASATAAAASASAAATSASNASTSATNAASSASTASTQASNASTSATNAANSATAAASSASTASTAATNAGNSATAAATSATNASNSASSASTSASNASTSATSAANSATTATTQATNASNSASAASTSASNASTSATNAANSATASASSATAAAASAAAAAASFDAFDDIYLGAKSSDPTVDNDGNALTVGDQYFNTSANELRVYNGSTWQAASTVGGTVASLSVTGATTLGQNPTLSAGTANGVAYLNGSKVLTTGSALTFNGTSFAVGGSAIGDATITARYTTPASGAAQTMFGGTDGTRFFQLVQTGSAYSYAGVGANELWYLPNGAYTALTFGSDGNIPIKWISNGSEQMRLTSTGLGIGTSNPDVFSRGDARILGISSTGSAALAINAASGSNAFLQLGANGTRSFQLLANTTATYFQNAGATPIVFQTSFTDRMTLDSSGNLGLGVTPSAWGSFIPRAIELPNGVGFASQSNAAVGHFSANAYYDGSWRYKANGVAARYALGSDTHAWYTAPSGTAGNAISFTQAMTLDANGALNVAGATNVPTINLSDTAGDVKAQFLCRNSTTGNVEVTNTKSASLVFGTSNTERARIDSSGNLLVGVSSTGGVAGTFVCPGTFNYTTGSGANVFVDSGGRIMRSTSSLKYKTDVQDSVHGLADVLSLRAVTYKSKGESDGDNVFGGLIAEEVHAAGLSEFVQYADDGTPDALSYGPMVSLAFKAIQEQQVIINQLKARLDAANL